MGERERIALFNMILEYLPEAVVIDAYAGSGSLGLEALSRGAKKVFFLEKNSVALRTVKENCATFKIKREQVEFYQGAVKNFEPLDSHPIKVDIILADPPYDDFKTDEVIRVTEKYLKAGGILVLSNPSGEIEIPGAELLKTRKYARAHISIYRKS